MHLHRQRIVDVLQLFASKDEQFEQFWAEEEKICIPDVLLDRWEEVYWQNDPKFESGFNVKELHDLYCYYDFLLTRIGTFPTSNFRALMTDVYWDSVCRLAESILEKLQMNEEAES